MGIVIRLIIGALGLVVFSAPAYAHDMSGWTDKTICRLVKKQGTDEYIKEAKARNLSCAADKSSEVLVADFDKGWRAAQAGDFETALAEWTPLAQQGHAKAQTNLGVMYRYGKGVLENDKTAVMWYTKAAEQGYANAQTNLGFMYRYGRGVRKNYKTAVMWYTKAAEQGYAKAQSNLGVMYDNGDGVLTDYVRAYMWYNLGAYNGNKLGTENKTKLAKTMTSSQIAKAQEMSSRCLESGYTDC